MARVYIPPINMVFDKNEVKPVDNPLAKVYNERKCQNSKNDVFPQFASPFTTSLLVKKRYTLMPISYHASGVYFRI